MITITNNMVEETSYNIVPTYYEDDNTVFELHTINTSYINLYCDPINSSKKLTRFYYANIFESNFLKLAMVPIDVIKRVSDFKSTSSN